MRARTDRQTDGDDRGDLIICPMLCYSNGTDNKGLNELDIGELLVWDLNVKVSGTFPKVEEMELYRDVQCTSSHRAVGRWGDCFGPAYSGCT